MKKNETGTLSGLFKGGVDFVTIDGYMPDCNEKKMYVVKANNVAIFKGNKEKGKDEVKALYVIGKLPSTAANKEFIEKYGNRIIIVSPKFLKLSKKYQRILVDKCNFEVAGVPERFTPAMEGLDGTNLDRKTATDLQLIEKYGKSKVKRALKKEFNYSLKSELYAGGYLAKEYKKAQKTANKEEKAIKTVNETTEELKNPVTFSNC